MLSSRSFVILFLFSTVLQLTYARSHKHGNPSHSRGQDFDVIVFSQSWPETFCYHWKENHPSHKCHLPSQKEWTIHGVWPSQFQTRGPSFCNTNLHFNQSALSPILRQLDEKWINIEGGRPRFSFWKHEWDKHGTCAAVLTDFNSELKYFQKGLDLLDEYDMTRILSEASILPGQNYAIQEIIDGVQEILGKTVQIQCIKNPETHESYLSEIRICLDKSLKLTNCDEISGYPTNCNRKNPVNYPSATPSNYDDMS